MDEAKPLAAELDRDPSPEPPLVWERPVLLRMKANEASLHLLHPGHDLVLLS